MAEFYPSEVARLVLGYLNEVNCLKSWKTFLEESSDLQEHNRLYKAGKFCSTNVNGKSLLDILDEYGGLKKSASDSCTNKTYTPSKVNGNAYKRFESNQKIRTQSVVSLQTSHVRSSPTPRTPLRSPMSRPIFQTPRRRLECQSMQLNFGDDTNPPSNNVRNISGTNNINTNASPVISKEGTHLDFGTSSVSPKVHQSTIKVLHVNKSSPSLVKLSSSPSQLPSSSNFAKTPDKTSDTLENASGLRTEFNKSDTPTHSTPNENLQVPTDNLPQPSESDIALVANKRNSSSKEAVISVLNKSFVYLSSETTNAIESLEGCSTPQYNINPPPYNRAPLTNSPRIMLSHDRSLIASLTTPVKDRKSCAEEEWSPKRKGTLPRRRLVTESPLTKYIQQPDTSLSFDTVMENLFGPEEALFNDPLVQLLTENINKVKQSDMHEEPYGQDGSVDDIVRNAAELIEDNPVFEKYFSSICSNRDVFGSNSAEQTTSKLDDAKCVGGKENEVTTNLSKTTEKIVCDKNFNETNQELPENVMDTNESDFNLNSNGILDVCSKVIFLSENAPKDSLSGNLNSRAENVQSSSDIQQTYNPSCHISQTKNFASNNNSSEKQAGTFDEQVGSSFKQADSSQKRANSFSIKTTTELTKTCNDLNNDTVANGGNFQLVDSTVNLPITNSSVTNSGTKNQTENLSSVENCSEMDIVQAAQDASARNDTECSANNNPELIQNKAMTNTRDTPIPNAPNCEQPTNDKSEMTIIKAELSNQPNTLLEVPLPTVPTFIIPSFAPGGLLQNNMYRIIVNTPLGEMCLPVSAVPTSDVSNSIIINPAPTVLSSPLKTANLVAANENITVGNEVTIPNSNKASKRKQLRKNTTKKSEADQQNSSPKQRKKNSRPKRTKRKLISLFSDSPPAAKANITPIKNDTIPVLSIPESSCNSEQSSAFKLLSQITGKYEKADKSPVLKSLMSNAAVLSKNCHRLNTSHVRCLDFTSDSNTGNESNSSREAKKNKL